MTPVLCPILPVWFYDFLYIMIWLFFILSVCFFKSILWPSKHRQTNKETIILCFHLVQHCSSLKLKNFRFQRCSRIRISYLKWGWGLFNTCSTFFSSSSYLRMWCSSNLWKVEIEHQRIQIFICFRLFKHSNKFVFSAEGWKYWEVLKCLDWIRVESKY